MQKESENNLNNISSVGQVTIDNESFKIREGRLSFTPKEDFYLVNFWIKPEDSDPKDNVFPPTIELLIKTEINLLNIDTLKLKMPSEEDAGDEWFSNYNTGYYDGIHQGFEDGQIEISMIKNDLYYVEFSGVPDRYKLATGFCILELKNELIKKW